jgi:hypothetical protein
VSFLPALSLLNQRTDYKLTNKKKSVLISREKVDQKILVEKTQTKSIKSKEGSRRVNNQRTRIREDKLKNSSFYLYNRSPMSMYVGKEYSVKMYNKGSAMIKSFYKG